MIWGTSLDCFLFSCLCPFSSFHYPISISTYKSVPPYPQNTHGYTNLFWIVRFLFLPDYVVCIQGPPVFENGVNYRSNMIFLLTLKPQICDYCKAQIFLGELNFFPLKSLCTLEHLYCCFAQSQPRKSNPSLDGVISTSLSLFFSSNYNVTKEKLRAIQNTITWIDYSTYHVK